MSSWWNAAELAARRMYVAAVEPLLIAAKQRRRLALYGVRDIADPPCGGIDLGANQSIAPVRAG